MIDQMSAPIPGENYTSDTKNYPWHRPPEHTDIDKAMDDITKKLLATDSNGSVLTMLEMGVTVAQLSQMLLMSGVEKGKWTIDFALLLAGPTAHVISLMAKAHDIDFKLGIEDKTIPITSAYLKELKPKEEVETVEEPVAPVPMSKGFLK